MAKQPTQAERLAAIEAGIDALVKQNELVAKSLGRSIDQLRDEFKHHCEEEDQMRDAVNSIQIEVAQMRGGYRMFLKLCAFVGATASLILGWMAVKPDG